MRSPNVVVGDVTTHKRSIFISMFVSMHKHNNFVFISTFVSMHRHNTFVFISTFVSMHRHNNLLFMLKETAPKQKFVDMPLLHWTLDDNVVPFNLFDFRIT